MKSLVLSAVALGVFTAAAVGADRAVADEPFELNAAQLDGVTAGHHVFITVGDFPVPTGTVHGFDAGVFIDIVVTPPDVLVNVTPPPRPTR